MSKTVKRYIDQEEWIERLEEELKTTKNEQRKTYLNICINSIKCQPTLDEKEIIRKAFERVVERLENIEPTPWEIVKIVKEECGISE